MYLNLDVSKVTTQVHSMRVPRVRSRASLRRNLYYFPWSVTSHPKKEIGSGVHYLLSPGRFDLGLKKIKSSQAALLGDWKKVRKRDNEIK